MNRKILLLTLLLSSVGQLMVAQLSVTGEFRTKSMVDYGFMVPSKNGDDVTLSFDQRTRLNFDYQTEAYSSRIVLQDARMWGGDDLVNKVGMWGNSSSLGLHEAWFNIKLGAVSNLKVGRQEWSYDNMRILSNRNWATPALSYDGVLFQTRSQQTGISFDLGLSYNNDANDMGFVDNSNWDVDKIKTTNFAHIKKTFDNHSYISLLSMLTAKEDTASSSLLATGTHGVVAVYNMGKHSNDGFFGTFEGYYQHGSDVNKGAGGSNKGISAYMIIAEVGARTLNKKLEVFAGAELLSGHDYTNKDADYNNTRHSFDLMYSKRLPVYGGYMNHFSIQDSYLMGTKGGGYLDPYIGAKYKVNKKNIVEMKLFNPMLTTKVRAHSKIDPVSKRPVMPEFDADGNPVYWQGDMGQYVDLNWTHKINKEMVVKAGFSYANISDIKNQMTFGYENVSSKELYDVGSNCFAWVMISIKPSFFKSSK